MLKDEFCTPWASRCIILRGRGAARTKPCISSWSPSLAVGDFCHDVGCGLADFRRGGIKAKDRCLAPSFSICQYAKKNNYSGHFSLKTRCTARCSRACDSAEGEHLIYNRTPANSRFSEKNKNRKNPLRLMQNGSDEPLIL